MTSPIQPPPDQVILSPEFLRKHSALENMMVVTIKRSVTWARSTYKVGDEITEKDLCDNHYAAPRSIVAAIDPEYVREWDAAQTSGLEVGISAEVPLLVSIQEIPALQDYALASDSQAPGLTADPSPGVTVSPEGGEHLYPNFLCNIASRVLWLRQAIQKGEFTPQEAVKLARYTAPLPFEKELLSGKHEEVQRAIAAMQQEAGQ